MSHIVHDLIARGDARVVAAPAEAPVRHQVESDRNFGLPTALYGATVGCYLGFLVIVGSAFANPVLAIPMATMAAYAFSRFDFRFKRTVFLIVIASQFIPAPIGIAATAAAKASTNGSWIERCT